MVKITFKPKISIIRIALLGTVVVIGLGLLAINSVTAATPDGKFGNAKTPPFPQPAEKDLKKIVFIRYKPGSEKASKACNYNNVCDSGEKWKFCSDCSKPGDEEPTPTPTDQQPTPTPEESACYGFLSGAKPKWNQVEDYYYSNGLGNISNWATDSWEALVTNEIFRSGYLGNYTWGNYNLINSVSYGDYADSNVLAVTAIWYRGKTIYEYDIMFDTDYFPNQGYDLDTVALHEFGHAAGLDDLYDNQCQDEVMYGYLGQSEVKTNFGSGDITGIETLYGQ